MSWSIPHRPGNLATDAIPTRVGNQLRYRDSRITDLRGNALTEAAAAPVKAADLPTFRVAPAKAPMRALPIRPSPSVIPEKHRPTAVPKPKKAPKPAAVSVPAALSLPPVVEHPGRLVIKSPGAFVASLWADGHLEIEGLDGDTHGFVRLNPTQANQLARLLSGRSDLLGVSQ